MSEWWTYTLSDFLLFSTRTYYRLIELYNDAIWPAQLAGLAAGGAIVASMRGWRGGWNGLAVGLLAACWLWIAWAFHYERYTQINWAATWFAAAFAIEAILLALAAATCRRSARPFTRSAAWLVAIVVFGYPFLALLSGRTWTTAEVFGVAPDPTAIATVAALGVLRGVPRWVLTIVPLAWCAIAAATLWAMNEIAHALVVVAATALAVVATGTGNGEPRVPLQATR